MLSGDSSDEICASSPATVYGPDNERGFSGMEVSFVDQSPELASVERSPSFSQLERPPSNQMKSLFGFTQAKNDGSSPADIKRSRNWRLWLLITILTAGIIIALAIALPLSLRRQGRESR